MLKKGGKLLKDSGMKPLNTPKTPTMADLDKWADLFHLTFCMKAGWISYIGIFN